MTEESKEIINVMKEMFSEMDRRFIGLENEIKEVRNEIKEVNMKLENETNKNIQILVDGHLQNTEKLQKLDTMAEDIDVLKFDVDVIKAVVTTHSSKLQAMKKAL